MNPLTENYEFRRAYARGQNFVAPALVTYLVRRRGGGIRVGITAGKKVGNAVKRNRARRVIRAAYTAVAPQLSGNWEVVFVARGKTPFVKCQAVRAQLERTFRSLGIIV